jgi:hypothetical protein
MNSERELYLESLLHEIMEIYAGMEGFVTETAPEAYLQTILKQMYDVAKKYEEVK